MAEHLVLTVNGEPRRIAAGASIADLVLSLDLDPRKVAVEHNGEIAPRSTLADVRLSDGDELEIVHFVGGGGAMLMAYNCRADGNSYDLEAVDRAGALALIDTRWAMLDADFDSTDEALETLMFGFYRDEADYIEIHVQAADFITLRHQPEREGYIGEIFGRRDVLIHLRAREELEAVVSAYFESSAAGFAEISKYPNEAIE